MYGIVGLRQPYNPTYAILDSYNIISRSGYYSNDNPFAKVEFIIDNMDYSAASNSQKNEYIKNMQISAMTNVFNDVFCEPDYIDRNFLYKNPLNMKNTEILSAGFCGYEINVSSRKNIAFEIGRMIFNFSGTGTLKLLLFSSQSSTPLQSKTITITNSNHVEDLKWVVDNSSNTYKSRYYIGYLKSSVTGTLKPYARDFSDSSVKSIISDLSIESCFYPNQTTETMFADMELLQYGLSEYYGLNPDITVYYDYTDLILRNEKLFAKAIDISFQIKIIQSYIASLRSNKNERESSDMITKAMAELEGVNDSVSVVKKKGIYNLLIGEIQAIKSEIKKLRDGYFIGNNIKIITLT